MVYGPLQKEVNFLVVPGLTTGAHDLQHNKQFDYVQIELSYSREFPCLFK